MKLFKIKELTPTQAGLYEKEIKRLRRECNDWIAQYEIADKYKKEYELLCKEYKEKLKKLDTLLEQQKKMNNEISIAYKEALDNAQK